MSLNNKLRKRFEQLLWRTFLEGTKGYQPSKENFLRSKRKTITRLVNQIEEKRHL